MCKSFCNCLTSKKFFLEKKTKHTMGNKIATFTEQQLDDYQVSWTSNEKEERDKNYKWSKNTSTKITNSQNA